MHFSAPNLIIPTKKRARAVNAGSCRNIMYDNLSMCVLFLILAKSLGVIKRRLSKTLLICVLYGDGRLAIVGKLLLEFLAGEEDAALDRAERKIHMLGDLVVFVTGNVHREGYAVFV